MKPEDLITTINEYNRSTMKRSWINDAPLSYSNEYIECKCFTTSNHHVQNSDEMMKQWNIIFVMKKDISNLPNVYRLKSTKNFDITKVTKGKYKGYYGIRVYGMKKDPTEDIIIAILDCMFGQ